MKDAPDVGAERRGRRRQGGDESDDDDDKLIAELAELPAMKYERERKKAAEQLGVRASILDRLVAAERAKLGLDEDDGKQRPRDRISRARAVAGAGRRRCAARR